MGQRREVSRREAELDDRPVLAPPWMGPLYSCATAVQVFAFVPNASIELEIDGSVEPPQAVGYPLPNGALVAPANPLVAGQSVRARQTDPASGLTSDFSPIVTVQDHRQDFPAGPPRPELFVLPLFDCGARTGVGNLLPGASVWITAGGAEVGRVDGCGNPQGVNLNPSYTTGQLVRGWSELCGDPSPPSIEEMVQPAPATLAAPAFAPVYESSTQLEVQNIADGAKVTLARNGMNAGTYRCWGGSVLIGGLAPFSTTDSFSAVQQLCPSNPTSPPGTTGVQPCSQLPAPGVGPAQAGDVGIVLTSFVPDAVITIYVNHIAVAAGGGPVVQLPQPLVLGDLVHVAQDLPGGCRGQTVREVRVACTDPPFGASPASLNLFPVASFEYDADGRKGSVYFPADDDGTGQPFNQRLAALGQVPIVFLVHGNHWWLDPSYQGYDYFQHSLASKGIVAVAVDCNKYNYGSPNTTNDYAEIERRADLVLANIDLARTWAGDPSSPLHDRIDFGRTGLMGHSRGAETVVLVGEVNNLPGVSIRSVLSLAPTDFRRWDSIGEHLPRGFALDCLLPAGDGDVWTNDGAKFYDQAEPGPFKSQQYVHFANHNYFNRVWMNDDAALMGPPVMARGEHEQILLAYGCALFRDTLLGHAEQGAFLEGGRRPSGARVEHVYLSHERVERTLVDNHEERNGIATNSMGQPTAQSGGLNCDEYTFAQSEFPLPLTPLPFDNSFYGRSVGMAARGGGSSREYRTELDAALDLREREVWIRAAEVYVERAEGATGFRMGVEDAGGLVSWIDTQDVGGLARPYPRGSRSKTMLQTLRFCGACFASADRRVNLSRIVAIRMHFDRNDERDIAVDDLHIVS